MTHKSPALERLIPTVSDRHRAALLHFALAKAREDQGDADRSFAHYQAGNAARHAMFAYKAHSISAEVDRAIEFFTPARVAASGDHGHPSTEPIFIVGLPRSGSTLIEQILASHSTVEGTSELPYIPMLVHRLLAVHWTDRRLTFPQVLERVSGKRLRELGQAYLDAATQHRRLDRPHFIDKLPNNWLYVGFIRLILPNAKIVDTRREAMACCWSNYRQWFARGQEFSYDLRDLGRYYRDYSRMMTHFDRLWPGAVHRVDHETLLDDPDGGIRALLAALGLRFEQECLAFHTNGRAVRTASAQQVRRPIRRSEGGGWRDYERFLGPLRDALETFE